MITKPLVESAYVRQSALLRQAIDACHCRGTGTVGPAWDKYECMECVDLREVLAVRTSPERWSRP